MTSILAKVRTIGLSNLHTVLDKVLNLNSVGEVEQYVRDLEEARKDLEGDLAEARFVLRTKQNDLATHTNHATALEHQIRTLMGAGGDQNSTSAKLLAVELATLRPRIATEQQQVADQNTTVNSLSQAVTQVNAKEAEMKGKLGDLRSTVGMAKAKQRAANALDAVGGAMAAGGSVDSALDRAGRESARSNAAFDRAMSDIPGAASTSAEADAILAELAPKSAAA